jgi:Na+/melibiose symporter-like transporter
MLVDSLSKRMAIASGYVAIGLMYLSLPLLFGAGVGQLLVVMFLSSAVMQIVSPSLKSAVALVSRPRDVAVVATSVTIASSIASALGSSLVAPLLIKLTSLEVLLVLAAAIMGLGAWRTLQLPKTERGAQFRDAVRQVGWREHMFSLRRTALWLYGNRSIGALILVGAIAVSLYEAFTTLIPVYVRDVLNSDPTNAVYIFAPAGIGFLVGMMLTPLLIDRLGARKLAVGSVFIMSVSMVMFGMIDVVAPILAPISPLRLVGAAFDVSISNQVLAASVIALPANFGSTAAGSSVQAFINRRVPLARQGATFGLQEVQENVSTLALVLLVGVISSAVGPRIVFVLAPILAFGMVLWLITYSFKLSGETEASLGDAWDNLIGTDDVEPAEPPVENT